MLFKDKTFTKSKRNLTTRIDYPLIKYRSHWVPSIYKCCSFIVDTFINPKSKTLETIVIFNVIL